MSDQHTPYEQRELPKQPSGSTWGDLEAKHISTRFPEALHTIFARLNPSQVEQFTQSYQLWSLQQRIAQLQQELASVERQIEENASLVEMVQPSPIALSVLARLQASGVENLLLLDRMLDRGDTWLDHTAQLLERCEGLDLIRGDYTRWCENALEGAYDWLDSMSEEQATQEAGTSGELTMPPTPGIILTSEEQLLQRLMTEGELIEGESEPAQPEQAPVANMFDTGITPAPIPETLSPQEPIAMAPPSPELVATAEPAEIEPAPDAEKPQHAPEEPVLTHVASTEATPEEAKQIQAPESEPQASKETDTEQGEAHTATQTSSQEPGAAIIPMLQAQPEQIADEAEIQEEIQADLHTSEQGDLQLEEASTIPSLPGKESAPPEAVVNNVDTLETIEQPIAHVEISEQNIEEKRESRANAEEIEAPEERKSEVNEGDLAQATEENEDEDTQQDLRKHIHKPQEKTSATQPALPAHATIAPEQRPIEDEPTIPLISRPQPEDQPLEHPEQGSNASTHDEAGRGNADLKKA